MKRTLGQRIAALRENKGLSQDELAAASGISRPQIPRLENDSVERPRRSTLKKLGDFLGEELVADEPTPPANRAEMPATIEHRIITPVMVADPNLDHLSDAEQAAYWKRLYQGARRQLDARDHEEAMQHARPLRAAGSRKTNASPGAASLRLTVARIVSDVPAAPVAPAAGVQRWLRSA